MKFIFVIASCTTDVAVNQNTKLVTALNRGG